MVFGKRGSARLSGDFSQAPDVSALPKKSKRLSFRSKPKPKLAGGASASAGAKAKRNVYRGAVSTRALADTWDEKDCHGVRDTVMLEDYKSDAVFLKNLEVRFQKNLIYTYIGSVCISINPYGEIGIYTNEHARMYSNVNMYELPPHVYAVADLAYRQMRDELIDQCVLISGESGAGKTEASKKILHFLTINSTNTGKAGNIRDRLMGTNVILEAFGNAKTIRNDNSSRFGKYMEVQFDHKGEPLGGRILNYLLEKVRVVSQMNDERNFHIFYYLLRGGRGGQYGLKGAPEKFVYTNQGGTSTVKTIDDAAAFKEVEAALRHEGFSSTESGNLLSAVSAVLLLGQLKFEDVGNDESRVLETPALDDLSRVIGVSTADICRVLTHRTVAAGSQHSVANLNLEKALYARDALAKSLYDRTFSWVVGRINEAIVRKDPNARNTVLGILDIYGFEIMKTNSFEQFCINYCNEKLQQVFIELTLKAEQEEYRTEGIKWEPVEFFDNKVICELVESKRGIITMLDEECIRPGKATDLTFLGRMDDELKRHKHYMSLQTVDRSARRRQSFKKSSARSEFRIVHYAGTVTYTVDGFLDKNNDLLFRDLKEAMGKSTNAIVSSCFPVSELDSKKRPVTAATQFKKSLNLLVDILMQKTPSYVRCIKPNSQKARSKFDRELVQHQVVYLGLMENLRVRRAGFAYRRLYDVFLERYKPLSKKTWPHWNGEAREGVMHILDACGLQSSDYQCGKTKIFIREPKKVMEVEGRYMRERHALATKIQAKFKAHQGRKNFLLMKSSVDLIARQWRKVAAMRYAERLKVALQVIKDFIVGWLHRNEPMNDKNRKFILYVRVSWLLQLRSCLPRNVLDHSWIQSTPTYLQETSALLRRLNLRTMVRKYVRGMSRARKTQMDEKLVASQMFRDKKASYPHSISEWFQSERLAAGPLDEHRVNSVVNKILESTPGARLKYITDVTKFDRSSYKENERVLVLTSTALCIVDPKSKRVKFAVDLPDLREIHVAQGQCGLMVIKTDPEGRKDKGCFILYCDHAIECCTKIGIMLTRKVNLDARDRIKVVSHLEHRVKKRPSKPINSNEGPVREFKKDRKSKQLVVTTRPMPAPEHWKRWEQTKGSYQKPPSQLEFGTGARTKSDAKSLLPAGSGAASRPHVGGRGRGAGRGQHPGGRGGGRRAAPLPPSEEDDDRRGQHPGGRAGGRRAAPLPPSEEEDDDSYGVVINAQSTARDKGGRGRGGGRSGGRGTTSTARGNGSHGRGGGRNGGRGGRGGRGGAQAASAPQGRTRRGSQGNSPKHTPAPSARPPPSQPSDASDFSEPDDGELYEMPSLAQRKTNRESLQI